MTQPSPAHSPLRIFWLSGLITIALGVVVAVYGSMSQLLLFAILVVLEVTFSFDNAVINSKVLARMSKVWQTIFLTIGIFIAVFVVRFALPIVIVMIAAGKGFMEVVNLALYQPVEYGHTLHAAAPVINAFGGAFLIMIGISYFMDRDKEIHWLGVIERKMASAARWQHLKTIIMVVVAIGLAFAVAPELRTTVLIASLSGIALHMGIELFGSFFDKHKSGAGKQVGWAAFSSFVYLEVLDASFSFDGVLGAFALTNSVLLIICGLGAGAIWVRSLTVYLLHAGTLTKYRYLEHGAHWAIMILGILMMMKLLHIEMPEWFTGTIGIVCIALAISSSIRRKTIQ